MNKIAQNIPNMIKQPAQCCVYCGKSYKKRTNLDKHVILCELLNKSKKQLCNEDEEEEIPSQKKQYKMLLELANKINKIEEKLEEVNKWVVKRKKKINVIDYLNTNIKPEIRFDNLIERVIITHDDIKYLFDHTFIETLNHIFSRNIYNLSESPEEYPIFAFVQKSNIFYIYENEENKWMELSREKLIKFLDRVYMKLHRSYMEYKKINADKIRDDESFSILCDKTSVKMSSADFRQDCILSKIKTSMYSRMKTDMKGLVEYEFEF